MGRQPGVEHQLSGRPTGALSPEREEAEDLVILVPLADPGVGVAGQESEDALLPTDRGSTDQRTRQATPA